jgi:DNA-binding IscR family transcriptional regulator
MTSQLHVQYAVMCLQELDRRNSSYLDVQKISREGGIPQADCREVLKRLHAAGIIDAGTGQTFALRQPLESLTALQVIQAIWTTAPKEAPAFRMLIAPEDGALRKTLEAVGAARSRGISVSEGTWN